MVVERSSPCKVNLLLNILGRRPDGYHELETLLLPVPLHDTLSVERQGSGIVLTCNHPELPVDSGNLVWRAAEGFLKAAGIGDGVRIHLEKRLPLAAGLGGGSANAAVTLRALNDLFGGPLPADRLQSIAAGLGSDVPFFLQDGPALAVGRGEQVTALSPFDRLCGCGMVLVHPGFGVSTAWAYRELAGYPEALNGRAGRGRELVEALRDREPTEALRGLYNSLEAPVLPKYPLLRVYQDFFRESGALATLMSGSGSTTFALTASVSAAAALEEQLRAQFGGGEGQWTAIAAI